MRNCSWCIGIIYSYGNRLWRARAIITSLSNRYIPGKSLATGNSFYNPIPYRALSYWIESIVSACSL